MPGAVLGPLGAVIPHINTCLKPCRVSYYDCSHFIEEDTEAEKGNVTNPKPHNQVTEPCL